MKKKEFFVFQRKYMQEKRRLEIRDTMSDDD